MLMFFAGLRPAYRILNRAWNDVEGMRGTRLTRGQKREAFDMFWSDRRGYLRDAFAQFRARGQNPAEAPELGDEDDPDSDTPILDFWRWLIDSGRIQAFMSFLVNEFLPLLFDLIVKLVLAFAAAPNSPAPGSVVSEGVTIMTPSMIMTEGGD